MTYGDAHARAGEGGAVDRGRGRQRRRAGGHPRRRRRPRASTASRVRDVIDWMWLTAEPPVRRHAAPERRRARRLRWSARATRSRASTSPTSLFDGVRDVRQRVPLLLRLAAARGACGRRSTCATTTSGCPSSAATSSRSRTSTDDDVARIVEQRLSPLYVSLHAVDPDVRATLVCATTEDRALERIDELLAGGIELHVQIVLVPGVNDGEQLQRTLAWLAERDCDRVGRRRAAGLHLARSSGSRAATRTRRTRRRCSTRSSCGARAWRGERGVRWVYAGRRVLPRRRPRAPARRTTTTASRSTRTASGWRARSSTSSTEAIGLADGGPTPGEPRASRRARHRRAVRAGPAPPGAAARRPRRASRACSRCRTASSAATCRWRGC